MEAAGLRTESRRQPRIWQHRALQGFTLIELMIVVVVAGILAAVALPAYQQMVIKGRRADAVAALSAVQQAQERWRANNARYTDDLNKLGLGNATDKGHYLIALDGVDAAGYTVTATVAEGSPQAGDSACSTMSIRMLGGNAIYTPTASNGGCWPR
jgi:type IV pilus assembly protein PilE